MSADETVAQAETEAAPETVSKEEYEKAENNYNAMLGRYKQAEAKIQELGSMVTELQSKRKAEEADETQALTLRQQVSELQDIVRRGEDRAERLKKGAARHQIVTGLIQNDADPALAEMAADSILANNGSKINAVETDSGSYAVDVETITGDRIPVSGYIAEYMATDAGKRIVAPKANPTVGGKLSGSSTTGDKIAISSKDFSKLSYEDMRSGKYTLQE